ncbi:MAG: hypothetical protein GF353_22985, partial [Candidatus Lokiarchaeota archaeon]|nr:hypothetical protein [Candidatus Lokiarchaeota archaeon]
MEVSEYLDPNDPDFDNDGIMDGVETSALVRGEDIIEYGKEYLTVDNDYSTYDEFYVEIPDIGRVYDAN